MSEGGLIDNLFENLVINTTTGIYTDPAYANGFRWAETVAPLFLAKAVDSPLARLILKDEHKNDKALAAAILDHLDACRELGDDVLAMGLQHNLENPKAFCLGASMVSELGARVFGEIKQPLRAQLYARWRAEFDEIANAYYGSEIEVRVH